MRNIRVYRFEGCLMTRVRCTDCGAESFASVDTLCATCQRKLSARIAGLNEQVAYYRGVCEEQAMAIGVLDRGADEQAATERTLRKRIAELTTMARTLSERTRWLVHDMDMLTTENKRLQALVAELEASQAKRTQLVIDATLRKAGG